MPHGFLAAPQQGRTAQQSLQSFRNAFRIIRNVAFASRLEGGVMVRSCKETQLQSKSSDGAARCHLPLSASAAEASLLRCQVSGQS